MRSRTIRLTAFSLAAVLVAVLALSAIAAAPAPPNIGKALEEQRRLAAERPQDPAVFNDMGNLLMLAHRPADAETAYRRAVELDPAKVSALFNLGLLLQQRGEDREALSLFERVVKQDERYAWAHYQIGTIRESRGQEAGAIDAYAAAFSLDPQLAFSDVNPHIVENRLVTQAMLRAYKADRELPHAPKFYDDPNRIAALLVPPPAPRTPTSDEEGTTQQAAQAQPGAQTRPGGQELNRNDLQPGRRMGQPQPPGMGGRPAPGGSVRGGYVPPGGYTPPDPNVPRGLRQWNRPEPQTEVNPGEGMQPGQVITPPPGGVYYQPGLPSTGRLDIRLLPGSKPRDREARS
ncbi:MAG TPA: tetratricopeptide repeat protein [Thermoanaerobaculia bacterium]|nr:tetratricopeptide repeat protein [Thermoanaerobaculia bacterium]